MTKRILALGIDAGASATRGVLIDGGQSVVGRAAAGGANLRSVPSEAAAKNIGAVLQALLSPEVEAICVGAAGIDSEADRKAFLSCVKPLIPNHVQLLLLHDGQIALRAGTSARPAMAILAGTGSLAYGERKDGSAVRAGGYGAVIGDDGSAYAIGLAALRHTARALDGINSKGLLAACVLGELGAGTVRDLVERVATWPPDVARIARLAQVVGAAMEAGDAAARGIAGAHGRALGDFAQTLARTIRGDAGQRLPVVLAGGAFDAVPALAQAVSVAVDRTGLCDVRRLDREAALCAAQIALARIHHPD